VPGGSYSTITKWEAPEARGGKANGFSACLILANAANVAFGLFPQSVLDHSL
jgi:hypothetical protein